MKKEQWEDFVKLLALLNIIAEKVESLKYAPIVKQGLKNKLNGLAKEMDRSIMVYIEKLYETDEMLFQQMQQNIEAFLELEIVEMFKQTQKKYEQLEE
jgi:hypothetical protein